MARLVTSLVVAAATSTTLAMVPVNRAMACSCIAFTEKQAFAAADVVFEGVVVAEPFWALHWFSNSAAEVRFEFAVESVAKGGPLPEEVEVATAQNGASCGAEFAQGQRWRVFADSSGDHLASGLCSGNRLLGEDAGQSSTLPTLLLAVVSAIVTALLVVGRAIMAR
jgi:hypothetical protein